MRRLLLVAAALLALASAGRAENGYAEIQLGRSLLDETSGHAMLGIDMREWGGASGLTTTFVSLADGRSYVSVQPLFPMGLGVAGLVTGGGVGLAFGEGPGACLAGGVVGWGIGQVLTEGELWMGSRNASVFVAHQLDLLLPGLHPREKISLGIDAGHIVRGRVGVFRSFCSIGALDRVGFEGRLVVGFDDLPGGK